MSNTIWFAVPCFNEEEVIEASATVLTDFIKKMIEKCKISEQSRILYIDDGSYDGTWDKIVELQNKNEFIRAIKLSANRGHQNALLAGLIYSKNYADAVISMDADLQDDIWASEKMIDCFLEGFEIVYGVRSSRTEDSFLKRFTAESFYRFMKFLGADVIYNHADYRLMSKKAVNALAEYRETNLFLRGLVRQLGFSHTTVEYERRKRFAGKSKYPFRKMISFAAEGITSFSVKPIKIAAFLGGTAILISIFMLLYCIAEKMLGNTVPGWASLGASIWGIGGLQLFMMGILGEYIGKIYFETKRRPNYIIDKII